VAAHVVGLGQHAPGVDEDPGAGRGGRHLAGGAPQQPYAEGAFQRGQRAGDGRLGDTQLDGGVGEGARVDDRDETAQLPQLHTCDPTHNLSV
jgi:hypothetical protein